MPVQYFETPTRALSYEELTGWAVDVANKNNFDVIQYLSVVNEKYPDADLTDFMLEQTDKYLDYFKTGDGQYKVLGYRTEYQVTSVDNPINSNSTQIGRGSFKQVLNNGVQNVGGAIKRHITPYPASGGLGAKASYVIGSVGGALGAVSTGITLGKMIAPALYDAAPNFWQSIGVSEGSFEPDSWASLTNGSDSPFAGLFNMMLGIDPDTGKSQMFMDENALAYFAMAMAQNGVFAPQTTIALPNENTSIQPTMPTPLQYCPVDGITSIWEYHASNADTRLESTGSYARTQDGTSQVYIVGVIDPNYTISSPYYYNFFTVSRSPVIELGYTETSTNLRNGQVTTRQRSYSRTVGMNERITLSDGSTAYVMEDTSYMSTPSASYQQNWLFNIPVNSSSGISLGNVSNTRIYMHDIAELIFLGTQSSEGGVDGITNQPDATLPDVSTWDTVPNTLSSLQDQYPDLFSNPLVWDNWQPDGTLNQSRYVPVGMPQTLSNNYAQPTTGTQTQANTQIDTNSLPAELLQTLTNILTAPQTQTQPEPYIPPANPVDTGTGTTPTPLPPTGNASALWSVYHPTQAQVNSFGAWLWGSPFLTNIGKLFQNPIEGVISLHKVFVTPIDSGSGTIVVGTLDSGVSSATVSEQYIEIDCGSIDCYEEFGNVFDYDPYTKIALYLPFVGIVPLNVGDIMRSTINVKYGVDIFTGACIAMVEVSRDGNTATLYQYSGNCAVHYPLSNVQQSQLLSGLITVAAGVGAIVATGGAAAPAAATGIASGAMSALHTNIGRSGGFSANAGAMGIKKPYLIIERPQTKVADTFPELAGYPTNYSCKLNECSGHTVVTHVHIEGINATDSELDKINNLLMSGVIV